MNCGAQMSSTHADIGLCLVFVAQPSKLVGNIEAESWSSEGFKLKVGIYFERFANVINFKVK